MLWSVGIVSYLLSQLIKARQLPLSLHVVVGFVILRIILGSWLAFCCLMDWFILSVVTLLTSSCLPNLPETKERSQESITDETISKIFCLYFLIFHFYVLYFLLNGLSQLIVWLTNPTGFYLLPVDTLWPDIETNDQSKP